MHSVPKPAHRKRKRKPTAPDIPPALRRRAESLGLHAPTASDLTRLRLDQSFDSALMMLAWIHTPLGQRHRRMITLPSGETVPLITDEMINAAELYRTTHRAWQHLNTMPSRHTTSSWNALDQTTHGRSTTPEASEGRQVYIGRLWRQAQNALSACQAPTLVLRCLDDVVLDNTASPLLLDRPVALLALRRGLEALCAIFRTAPRPCAPRTKGFAPPGEDITQAILQARKDGLSYADIQARLTDQFGDQAPSKTWIYGYLKRQVRLQDTA
ncbi:hypothetical protein [Insolitispirillum peregrinum]|uniref:Uncharacterized protein n=1 Tax=Insolitispirillum peregrinum TaxID=80876 RepID=A0A1N7PDR6_9PROT|nr:hypothetical protein [Insolitispirillum peregrinum]SIT08529.1 hypothetical protein SAMN05421779_106235 [Insolitispirillum peregrinum]